MFEVAREGENIELGRPEGYVFVDEREGVEAMEMSLNKSKGNKERSALKKDNAYLGNMEFYAHLI